MSYFSVLRPIRTAAAASNYHNEDVRSGHYNRDIINFKHRRLPVATSYNQYNALLLNLRLVIIGEVFEW